MATGVTIGAGGKPKGWPLRFFGIARRVERNGQFVGAINALIPADEFSEVWGEVALGADSTVTMIRASDAVCSVLPMAAWVRASQS